MRSGHDGRPSAAGERRALAEVEAGVEKAREAFARRGGMLRLLADLLEIERSLELEVVEGEPDVPHADPGPGKPERGEQQHGVQQPEAQERAAGHRGAEPRAGEARVAPEEAPLAG